jgi:hypothetical protein
MPCGFLDRTEDSQVGKEARGAGWTRPRATPGELHLGDEPSSVDFGLGSDQRMLICDPFGQGVVLDVLIVFVAKDGQELCFGLLATLVCLFDSRHTAG